MYGDSLCLNAFFNPYPTFPRVLWCCPDQQTYIVVADPRQCAHSKQGIAPIQEQDLALGRQQEMVLVRNQDLVLVCTSEPGIV